MDPRRLNMPLAPSGNATELKQRIDSSFPSEGSASPSYMGSKSTAPNAQTTPSYEADPRKPGENYSDYIEVKFPKSGVP